MNMREMEMLKADMLKFSVKKKLTVRKLVRFLRWLDVLHNRLYVLERLVLKKDALKELPSNDDLLYMLTNSLDYVPHEDRLSVEKIEFYSPGEISIAGLKDIEDTLIIVLMIYFEKNIINYCYDNQKEISKSKRLIMLNDLLDSELALSRDLGKSGFSKRCIEEVLTKKIAPCADLLFRTIHKNDIAFA